MHDTTIPARFLEHVRELHQADPDTLRAALPEYGLEPLSGGRNNRVYRWHGPAGEVCLKLYRTDKRDRAACEFRALTHLAAHDVTAAPKALWHDPHEHLPAVAMTLEPGEAVPNISADQRHNALRAGIDVLQHLREIPLEYFSDLPRVDSAHDYLRRLNAHIRIVDWEFTGYSDTAYDAAELIEHPSAHDIDDHTWSSLLAPLGITDPNTRRRFLAAQRTVSLRWLAVLWKRRHQRTEQFHLQRQRTQHLLTTDFL